MHYSLWHRSISRPTFRSLETDEVHDAPLPDSWPAARRPGSTRIALQRKSASPRVSPAAKALLTRRLRHVAADLDFVGELSSAYEGWAASSKATSSRSGKRRSAPPRADVQPDASRPFRRSTSPRTG